jgi:hypothetical protein
MSQALLHPGAQKAGRSNLRTHGRSNSPDES